MKPVYARLRNLGYTNVGYIDDSLLCGDIYYECKENIQKTVSLIEQIGFIIHPEKSQFEPSKKITFLGNIIDSEEMIVTLPIDKKERIAEECKNLYLKDQDKIRNVAKVIGLIVSSFSAIEIGKLFYRNLEKEKIEALKKSKGNYEAYMHVTESMKSELKWWYLKIFTQNRKISHGNPSFIIETDASNLGWGAVFGKDKIGGQWINEEKEKHINYLELLAIDFALHSFREK